jgi:tetratricopeptide (TPR) repeat protein
MDTVALEAKLRIGELYFGQLERDSTLLPRARALFEVIRDAHPDDWRAYWFLGAIGSLAKDDSLSVRSYQRLTRLAPSNADGWVFLAGPFLNKNRYDEASRILERGAAAAPEDFRVHFFLGIAYSRLGRNADAAASLEKACSINPKDLDGLAQLALVYDTMKRFAESDSLYEKALRLDQHNHLVLNNYAYSLAERGLQLDRALAMSTRALEAQPENASYLDTKGWICFRLGQYRDALDFVSKAIARGDVSAVVYEHLGDIYFRLDDRAHALENWNAALSLDGGNQPLREKVARGTL